MLKAILISYLFDAIYKHPHPASGRLVVQRFSICIRYVIYFFDDDLFEYTKLILIV